MSHDIEHPGAPRPEQLVSEALGSSPARAAVFIARGMACPGCAMAELMTLREAAVAYNIDLDDLIADLAAC